MLDERQRRRSVSGHRIRPPLQPLPPHEAYHASWNSAQPAPDGDVIGAGAAGLSAALGLAPHRVTLLTKGPLGSSGSSPLAQGGIAAALGPDDGPALHTRDTLAAGGGLCDGAV